MQVPFLGQPAPFAVGPYVLAHVLECPVLLFFCLREAGGLQTLPGALRRSYPVASSRAAAAAAAAWAGRYAARLADYAGRFPLQWYNFYDFWGEAAARPAPGKGTDLDAQHGSPARTWHPSPSAAGASPSKTSAAVSRGAALHLEPGTAFRGRIERGAKVLADAIASGRMVYGVNTGYGDSCTVEIPTEVVEQLPAHLVRYHGCGLGEYFDEPTTVAILVTRLNSLAAGFSGVRWEVLQAARRPDAATASRRSSPRKVRWAPAAT